MTTKSKTITREEFYNVTATLVIDALAHVDSEQGKDWKDAGMPAWQRRLIQLHPRRDIGKTYTACRLAAELMPVMMVFTNQELLRRAVRDHERYGFTPTPEDYAFTTHEVLAHSFLPALGSNYMKRMTPPHFQLGIIDDATHIIRVQGERVLDQTRDTMLQCCTVVLELG